MNRSTIIPWMAAATLLAFSTLEAISSPAASRTRTLWNDDWHFHAGEAQGAEALAHDDSGWRSLRLPHDWGIEGSFRPELPNNTGKRSWAGIGWYRKNLTLAEADKGQRIFLDFDGAMSHPKVFVNGKLAGEWAYGYNSFRVEITDFVTFGGQNIVAVRLDNPAESSRWYPGGGIYRHVWLEKTAPVHIAHWGVFVHTPEVSPEAAQVVAEVTIDNQSARDVHLTVRHELLAPAGKFLLVKENVASIVATAGASGKSVTHIRVAKPSLWNVDSPRLYVLRTTVLDDGGEVDRVETPFGIRKIEWSAKRGFLLNDNIVKLNGVCMHSDLGALGMAFNERAAERQLQILRQMGCNAIRTSHNPPAPQLLDLCDRMGFVVMDELFDGWKAAKTPNDYSKDFDAWHEKDLVNFVRRDRNHPSVILWSTGNEVKEQGGKDMNLDLSRKLTAMFHREDPSRKVSNGLNNARSITNGFAQTIDIAGYNYKAIKAKVPNYLQHLQTAPGQPFFGAETSSAVSSRDVYFFPVNKNNALAGFQVSSYDVFAPPWAYVPDLDFDSMDQLPALAGEFVWTGFDYLGEPTPFNHDASNLLNAQNDAERATIKAEMDKFGGTVPSRSSYFGIVDLAGFPKDRFYLYQSRWRPDLPMAHILPHWNWPERKSQITPVYVYTSGDEAELFLNGKSLGRKRKAEREYRLRWEDVKYEPGELKVVCYKRGKNWAEAARRTTGPAAALKVSADRSEIRGDGKDLSFVTVEAVDSRGDVVPVASPVVRFALSGPGDVVAVDNGNAASMLPFQRSHVEAFGGKCIAIVQTKPGGAGEITLTARSEGLLAGKVVIRAR